MYTHLENRSHTITNKKKINRWPTIGVFDDARKSKLQLNQIRDLKQKNFLALKTNSPDFKILLNAWKYIVSTL